MALVPDRNGITFTLVDDGKGFDMDMIDENEKHGIMGMSERIEECGGQFKITSNPRKGTKISVKFKVKNDPNISL